MIVPAGSPSQAQDRHHVGEVLLGLAHLLGDPLDRVGQQGAVDVAAGVMSSTARCAAVASFPR